MAAPAGYGKTCLARAYLERGAIQSLWYTLERSDSDVAAFFADFGSGLGAAMRGARLLQYSPDIQDHAAFARAYFKHAFAQAHEPRLLVLDDYQAVAPGLTLARGRRRGHRCAAAGDAAHHPQPRDAAGPRSSGPRPMT